MTTDYLERQLGLRARLQIRLHIMLCDSCRRYLWQIRKMIGLLNEMPGEEMPRESEQLLLERFRGQIPMLEPDRKASLD